MISNIPGGNRQVIYLMALNVLLLRPLQK